MTPKTISLSVLLVLALLAGCRSTHNCSRRIAVLEADLQNTQIDLECAKADILAISKSTKPAPPPPTTMFSDAQFASFNSAMTQIVAELGTISDRLKPKEEGVVPKIGSLISWVLSNGANGAKIIESLKKAGLITSTEADGLSSLADQVKNLPPTTTVFRLDPSDREEVIKRLECICDGNKEIHKSIDGLNQTLGNSHQSPPHEDRFPLWEALTGLGTVALAIVTLKLASDARQGIKEQLDAQRLAQDKQFKEQQQAQENQFEEQRAIQNQQVVEQRLAHSIDIVLKMGERWESPRDGKNQKSAVRSIIWTNKRRRSIARRFVILRNFGHCSSFGGD